MENNPEYIEKHKKKEYLKKYRELNKDKLRKYIHCDVCGNKYMKHSKWHHVNTKKHKYAELLKKVEILENNTN